jgi:hypothetical protein
MRKSLGVDTVKWNFGKMSVGDESAFMSSVVLDSKYQVHSNLLVSIGWPSRMSIVLERIIIIQLGNL